MVRNKIGELRKKLHLKQSALASKVGIFQSGISDIETGKRKPNVYLAIKIAKVLGKSVEGVFPYHVMKKSKETIYEKYRKILGNKNLSKEEIDKMRVYVRLLALAIMEYLMKAKTNQIL